MKQFHLLSPSKFLRSIANKKIKRSNESFYPGLNPLKHYYEAPNYSHIDNLSLDEAIYNKRDSCVFDADINGKLPLHIGCDANANFNCMVIGQKLPNQSNIINTLHTAGVNSTIETNANKFCKYYKAHRTKEIVFYYDPTFIPNSAKNKKGDNFAQDYFNVLEHNGWKIKKVYSRIVPAHKVRYRVINKILREKDIRYDPIRFNKRRCQDLIDSLEDANKRTDIEDIKKDKRSERRDNVPPQLSTHYTDAFDNLIMGMQGGIDSMNTSTPSIPTLSA